MQLVGLLALALSLPAQQIDEVPNGPTGASTRRVVEAAARHGSLHVDGVLDDADWESAAEVRGFVQGEPVEGAKVGRPTEVRVLFDQDAIYVGARLFDDPAMVSQQLSRRDEDGQFDFFDVSLSPYHDRRTGYRFRVSASGVQSDSYLYDDTRDDDNWDAVWESSVSHDAEGWTVELRIPLSQIRFNPSDDPQQWGVNFSRKRVATNERSYLALESRQQSGKVSVFAVLDGLVLPARPSGLEIRPYTLAGFRAAPADAGNPFFDGGEFTSNTGLDFRAAFGTFSLTGTVNPDFGQVEVDPAVINLSAFETFYPERRPFFVEDARLIGFGLSGRQDALFYSRRIGRPPQVRGLDGADFVDVPPQTSILGAAKLAGRLRGGVSLGALFALSGRATGRGYFAGPDSIGRFAAEPRTVSAVLSAQKELRNGASQIRGTVTSLQRDLPASGTLNHLASSAWSAGIHWEHTWSNRRWAITGFFAGSLVQGDSTALIRIQRSSNHYFQRPDAARDAVDSAATSLSGREWRLQLDKRSGRHWTGGIWMGERTSGFEVNDLGFSQGNEKLDLGGRVQYSEIVPGSVFRSYRITASTFHNWRHDALDHAGSWDSWTRAYKRGNLNLQTNVTLLNYWELEAQGRLNPTTSSEGTTRGGPVMEDPGNAGFRFQVNTDRRRVVSLRGSVDVTLPNRGGSSRSLNLTLAVQPSPAVRISVGPEYRVETDSAQYVTTVDDPTASATYGRRYLFGALERRTFSLETRINMVFSPTLTLQLFAQPLLSTGDYLHYRTLTAPRSFAFDDLANGQPILANGAVHCTGGRACTMSGTQYLDFDGDGLPDSEFDERDFRVRSLRGNAVLRWEFQPGSAIFLVWQQSRDFRDTDVSRFSPMGEFGSLFGDPAENVLTLKATYWLGL